MNRITLYRPKERINKYHPYSVSINSEHVAKLGNDSQQTITTDSNEITVKVNLYWCGSGPERFKINHENDLKLKIRGSRFYNRLGLVASLLYICLAALSYLFADSELVEDIVLATAILMLLYLVFALTFKKDSWIDISEIEHIAQPK